MAITKLNRQLIYPKMSLKSGLSTFSKMNLNNLDKFKANPYRIYQCVVRQTPCVVRRPSSVVNNLLLTLTPPEPLGQCNSNFTGMLPRWRPTKTAKFVLPRLTRSPPELNIEKSLNANSSYTRGPISFKLYRNVA